MKNENFQNFFRELQIEFLIHELKDPLSVIETGLRTLLERKEKYGELSALQEKTLKRTLRNAQKARDMLYGLLEIGRCEANHPNCCCFEPAKISFEVLTETLELIAANISEQIKEESNEKKDTLEILSDCGIVFEIDPQIKTVEMFQDETRFRQILGNLIKNAFHYRKQRVEIKLRIKTVPRSELENEDYLVIEVTDDGPGIDIAHHQIIFQRYAQIKPDEHATLQRKGHGLGLAGALILAKSLGGNIELESSKGNGATFRLTLPLRSE